SPCLGPQSRFLPDSVPQRALKGYLAALEMVKLAASPARNSVWWALYGPDTPVDAVALGNSIPTLGATVWEAETQVRFTRGMIETLTHGLCSSPAGAPPPHP